MHLITALRPVRTIALLAALLAPAAATALSFPLPPPDVDVVGEVQRIQAAADETLIEIGRRHGVGYEEMLLANPDLDPWLPGAGTEVVVPTRYILPPGPREGIVVNLAELRMYYYPKPRRGEPPQVETYAVGIGRGEWRTPLGGTRIKAKVENPAWYPPSSVRQEAAARGETMPRMVPPGPDNPLGRFAMVLDLPGYAIHSTNMPWGVGMRVSHGCVRMYPEDIESMIFRVSSGTGVRIIDEPVKAGWLADELFVEVHLPPPAERAEDFDPASLRRGAIDTVAGALGARPYRVDRRRIEHALSQAHGMPVTVERQLSPTHQLALD